jgi:hypothetical protein
MRGGGDFGVSPAFSGGICDGRRLAFDHPAMELPEQPDRSEWRVIWIVFALALLVSVDWNGQVPTKSGAFIVLAVVAGALVIWHQQARQPH